MILLPKIHHKRVSVGFILSAIATFLLVLYLFFPGVLLRAAYTILLPVYSVIAVKQEAYPVPVSFASYRALLKRNDDLQKELASAETKLLILLSAKKDGSLFPDGTMSDSAIIAEVIGKPPFEPYDTFLIDAGSRVGVSEGALVKSPEGIFLGSVETVGTRFARVRLYSTPGREFSGRIGDKNLPVVARGMGSGNFRIRLPKDASISEGDAVSLDGIGNSPVGIVEKTIIDPSEAFVEIYFRAPINLDELSIVEVMPAQ